MWIYESPVGKMQIVRDGGRYLLRIGDDFCDQYLDPASAADNVFTFHTGCDLWDSFVLPADVPSCIDEWLCFPDPH